jgi:alkaline phosphatase D
MNTKQGLLRSRTVARIGLIILIAAILAPIGGYDVFAATTLAVTHGIATGDVTATSAVVWARANDAATLNVEYDLDPLFSQPIVAQASTAAATDYTAIVKLDGLRPDTLYAYRAWFSNTVTGSGKVSGAFKTAPAATTSRPVSFVWSGDLGGANYCRRVGVGYSIFAQMQSLNPDFFVFNGDMIYGDGICPTEGPDGPGGWENVPGDFRSVTNSTIDWTNAAQVRDAYVKHWRYNWADPSFQNFRRQTSMYMQWDDHDVINDFGGPWTYWNADTTGRAGFPNLVSEGRRALFDYAPIARNQAEPNRLYRSFTWGKDLDVFILDGRSYRSRNDMTDTAANNKTMLGAAQMQWLKQSLQNSTATWKVISSNVPLEVPTGSNTTVYGRDGFANGTVSGLSGQSGYERELLDLMRFMDTANLKNVVFLTTDAHFAQTLRSEVDTNGDGDKFLFHELVAGPLSANPLQPKALDPSLSPQSLYAEGNFFNFGYIQVQQGTDGKVHLIADIRGEDGQQRPGSLLDLSAH